MAELKALNANAYKWLMEKHPESWSRAFFPEGRACEAVENGISESFNSVILEARVKPILTMLEEIRIYTMERFFRMSTMHQRWEEDVCPQILIKMEEWCKNLRYWTVLPSDTHVFEVRMGFEAYQVDFEHVFCTCRLWEIAGIPCVHAVAAMQHTNQQPESFISPWFSKAKFVETYRGNIRPLNGSRMCPRADNPKPLPPPIKKMPGRPKLKRRKSRVEDFGGYKKLRAVGGTTVCKNCWEKGHNRRTCKNESRPKPPQTACSTGRPRTRDEPRPISQKRPKRKLPSWRKGKGKAGEGNGVHGDDVAGGSAGVFADGVTGGSAGVFADGVTGGSAGVFADEVLEGVQGDGSAGVEGSGVQRDGVQGDGSGGGGGEEELHVKDSQWLHDIVDQQKFIDNLHVKDMLGMGYSEDEVADAIRCLSMPETEVEPDVDAVPETDLEAVPETDVEAVPETDVEASHRVPAAGHRLLRRRAPSERINKIKLATRHSGPGSTSQTPMTLE